MSSHAVRGAETRARKRNRERGTNPQEALPGLPQDVVVTHILRSDTDPIVLARLRAVNRAMRDAVDETELLVEEMATEEAAELGCLDTLQHKLEKGRLTNKSQVCECAAKGGQLEVLQWARVNSCPWDWATCAWAARGGHMYVLQWAIENGCPWDWFECMSGAIEFEHLDMQAWLNENKAPELL